MRKIVLAFAVAAVIIGIGSGCSKKKGCMDPLAANYDPKAEEEDGTCQYIAGVGGNTTIVLLPNYNGNPVINKTSYPDSVFMKFNTSKSPGSAASAYDKIFVGEEGEDHIHCTGLKQGRYYVMVTGFDTTAHVRLTGGMPYTLTVGSGEVDVEMTLSN
jgi:hypothetical protein